MITLDEQSQVQKWLEAEKNGIPFPVDFEIAWSMAGYVYKKNGISNVKNNLEKEIDFLPKSVKNGQQGRSGISFDLTCDGFKHFCLMAKTAKGREIRQYFIESEKALKQAIPFYQENESPEIGSRIRDLLEMVYGLQELAKELLEENEALKADTGNLETVKTYLDMINRSVNTTHALTLQTKAIAQNIKAYA